MMDSLLDHLRPLPESFLIGVSGGRDSCALLDILIGLGKKPIVLHFNHNWRPESEGDAQWVKQLAKKHGLQIIIGKAPAKTPKTESEARRRRWAFFSAAARRLGIYDLVLAHHADDQVETFFLQLLRGTGSNWAGMAKETAHGKLIVHRPWLGVWRDDIAAYAKGRKLAWREDATNYDLHPLRNRLRHQLLPLLEKETAPGLKERLLHTVEIQRAEQEWTEEIVADLAKPPRLALRQFKGKPIGFQRRLLYRWLENQGISNLSFDQIEAARGLIETARPAKINLSKNAHLRRRTGVLFIEK